MTIPDLTQRIMDVVGRHDSFIGDLADLRAKHPEQREDINELAIKYLFRRERELIPRNNGTAYQQAVHRIQPSSLSPDLNPLARTLLGYASTLATYTSTGEQVWTNCYDLVRGMGYVS